MCLHFLSFLNKSMTYVVEIHPHGRRTRAPSQYPKRSLFVRSREVSKPRDLYLFVFILSDRSEIWQALRQHCCRCACQISKRYDNSKYQSRGFETSRDLTKRRLFGYWDGAQVLSSRNAPEHSGLGSRWVKRKWLKNCVPMGHMKFMICYVQNIPSQHWYSGHLLANAKLLTIYQTT